MPRSLKRKAVPTMTQDTREHIRLVVFMFYVARDCAWDNGFEESLGDQCTDEFYDYSLKCAKALLSAISMTKQEKLAMNAVLPSGTAIVDWHDVQEHMAVFLMYALMLVQFAETKGLQKNLSSSLDHECDEYEYAEQGLMHLTNSQTGTELVNKFYTAARVMIDIFHIVPCEAMKKIFVQSTNTQNMDS
jgi:hypothetical protein